jgi:hypothetical protein
MNSLRPQRTLKYPDVANSRQTSDFPRYLRRVTFKTVRGAGRKAGSRVVDQHIFTLGVPTPGSELVHMNLSVFGKGETPLQKETEVVIEKFEYFP